MWLLPLHPPPPFPAMVDALSGPAGETHPGLSLCMLRDGFIISLFSLTHGAIRFPGTAASDSCILPWINQVSGPSCGCHACHLFGGVKEFFHLLPDWSEQNDLFHLLRSDPVLYIRLGIFKFCSLAKVHHGYSFIRGATSLFSRNWDQAAPEKKVGDSAGLCLQQFPLSLCPQCL